MIDTVRVNIHD